MLKQAGRQVCEACGFDFSEKYGPSAAGIIDVHHTKPVHTLLPGDKARLEDLALLCANCHRVVYSKKSWLTIDQVRELLDRRLGGADRCLRAQVFPLNVGALL